MAAYEVVRTNCSKRECLGSGLAPTEGAPMQWACSYSGSTYAVGLHLQWEHLCSGLAPTEGAPIQWACTYSGSTYAVGLHLQWEHLCSGLAPTLRAPWTTTYRQPGMHTSCQPCTYVPCLVQPACCSGSKIRDHLYGTERWVTRSSENCRDKEKCIQL